MSIRVRNRVLAGSAAVVAVLVLLTGTLLAIRTGDAPEVRRIELVAEAMTWAGGNRTLVVEAGERIELVVVNRDPGMLHDAAIPELEVSTGAVAAGDSGAVRFTVPAGAAGMRYEYLCTYHPATMRGWIEVTE